MQIFLSKEVHFMKSSALGRDGILFPMLKLSLWYSCFGIYRQNNYCNSAFTTRLFISSNKVLNAGGSHCCTHVLIAIVRKIIHIVSFPSCNGSLLRDTNSLDHCFQSLSA